MWLAKVVYDYLYECITCYAVISISGDDDDDDDGDGDGDGDDDDDDEWINSNTDFFLKVVTQKSLSQFSLCWEELYF